MKFGASSYSISIVLAGLLGCGSSVTSAQTQPPPPERPALRDFGSSLKRLRWDEQKKAAVETQAKGSEEQGSDSDEEVVRIETSLVVCDVLVLDAKGRPVWGLTPGDFVGTEDGRPQQISTVSLGDGAIVPRSIVLIIDYSRSQLPFIKSNVEAAKALVDKLGPRDRMAVVTDDVELLAGFTGDKNELRRQLESLGERATSGRRLGRSAQYSALMATLREAFDEEDLRPIVIFQTDGDELNLLRDSPNRPPSLRPGMSQEAQRGLSRVIQSFRDNMREFSLGDHLHDHPRLPVHRAHARRTGQAGHGLPRKVYQRAGRDEGKAPRVSPSTSTAARRAERTCSQHADGFGGHGEPDRRLGRLSRRAFAGRRHLRAHPLRHEPPLRHRLLPRQQSARRQTAEGEY